MAFVVDHEVTYWNNYAGYEGPAAYVYDTRRDGWRSIPRRPNAPMATFESVWTGSEVLMWGHLDDADATYGAAYDLATGSWRALAQSPIGRRFAYSMVWTGTEVIVWGGGWGDIAYSDGAAYNPATDSWRTLPPAPIEPRVRAKAAWTGAQLLIWGGEIARGESAVWQTSDWHGDGAIYDPQSNSWTAITPAPIFPWSPGTSVWTGSELVLLFGITCGNWNDYPGCDVGSVRDGAAYDIRTNTWRYTTPGPLDERWGEASVWTGEQLVVWGGFGTGADNILGRADGAIYDPALDAWIDIGSP